MARFRQLILDLVICAGLEWIPRRLSWSRRSARVLRVSGGVSLTLGLVGLAGRDGCKVTALGRAIAGGFLLAAQYQLTEEESSVRGAVAALGTALILLGIVTQVFGDRRADEAMPA